MEIGFLGHQGWELRAEGAFVLVDPLLTPRFGHGGRVGRVFPPRRVDRAALAGVTAVWLTHEHEDHLDWPSLALLPRGLPAYLSARSSRAAFQALAELGLAPRPVEVGARLRLGALEIRTFAPELAGDHDEWDVLPFAATDGEGSFATAVDVDWRPAAWRRLVGWLGPPTALALANNATDFGAVQRAGPRHPPPDEAGVAAAWAPWLRALGERGEAPALTLICGGGFSLDGERAWMNARVFPAGSEGVVGRLKAELDKQVFCIPVPGRRWTLDRLGARPAPPSTLLRALPPARWPARGGAPGPLLQDWSPLRAPPRGDEEALLIRLKRRLDALAPALVGSPLHRALHALEPAELAGRAPSLAVVALTPAGARLLVWDASAARFAWAVEPDPVAAFAVGFEAHATDLLDLLEGRCWPTALLFGRSRGWGVHPDLDLGAFLWNHASPLRDPARALVAYRRLLRRAGARLEPAGEAR